MTKQQARLFRKRLDLELKLERAHNRKTFGRHIKVKKRKQKPFTVVDDLNDLFSE